MEEEILSWFAGKKVVVTGASGYLATNLIRELKESECTIVRLSRKKRLESVPGAARVVDVNKNVCQPKVFEGVLKGVDIVYHLAAQTSAPEAARNPQADLEINVIPMLALLETCRRRDWHPDVIFSGTVTEAGIPQKLPVDETHPDRPITIYDLHKLMAENYLKYYCRQGVVRGVGLRLANVYGPGPKSSSADRGIMNMMILRALAGKELTVYGKGDCLRDYIYIGDVIEAFLKAALFIEKLNGNHYILGSGKGYTIAQAVGLVAERAALKTGQRVEVRQIEPPSPPSPIATRNFVADNRRFHEITGWEARSSLPAGIDKTLAQFLKSGQK